MNKWLFIFFSSLSYLADAQNKVNDSIQKHLELPVTVISSSAGDIREEKYFQKIPIPLLQRTTQAQDLPYALNALAGVVVSSDAGTGTGYTDIKIRGTDLTRINVTMNGVPVNDPESQATYFVNTPDLLSSTTGLRIQKGVGVSKNGNASFGASIDIDNLDIRNEQPYLQFQTDGGSFETFRQTLKISTGLLNKICNTTLRVSSLSSKGYIERSSSKLQSIQLTSKVLINKHNQLIFNYLKGREITGQAWGGVLEDSLKTNRRYNELGLMSDGTYYPNQTDNYGQDYYQLFFTHQLSSPWILSSTLFYTRGKGYYEEYKMNQSYSEYGLSNPVFGNDTVVNTDLIRQLALDNHFYGARLSATYLSRLLDAGLYLNANHYLGRHFGEVKWANQGIQPNYRWYDLDAVKTDYNIYAMSEYRFKKNWSVLADIQYRHVNYTLNGFRRNPNLKQDLQFDFFNPKLQLRGQFNKHRVLITTGWVSKEPNRDDIETGSQLPKPEKLWDTEIQWNYTGLKNLVFQTTLYAMEYKDQLVLTGKINDVGAYTRTNIPRSYRRGIELEGAWKSNQEVLEIRLNVALSTNKISEFTEYIDDYDQGIQVLNKYQRTTIGFSPSLVAGGVITVKPFHLGESKNKLYELSLDYLPKWVGKQYLDNTTNQDRSIAAYFVQDVIANLPIRWKNKVCINTRIGVYNLLNLMYVNRGYTFSYRYNQELNTFNYFYPQSGIRGMLGVGIEF